MGQANSSESQMKEKGYRCDQCAKLHRKCDRRLPICTTCLKKDQVCSYLKGKGKKNVLSHIEEHIFRFKIDQGSKTKRKETSKEELALTHSKYRRNYKPRIIEFLGNNNTAYVQLDNLLNIKRKDLFENMMTIFQFPTSNSNAGISFLTLIEKLGILYKKVAAKELSKVVEKLNTPNLENLKDKAINNYFKYNNTVLPMFIRSKFSFNSKTEILKMAILIIGIDHMEKDELVKYAFKYLSFQLRCLLGVPHRIKPTLGNIQAVLILITFIKLPFIVANLDKYASFCHKASNLIGLHLTPPGLTKLERIERDMTYSCLLMAYLYFRIYVGFYIYLPYKPRTLFKEFKMMTKKKMNKRNAKVNILNNDVEYYISLTMSLYGNDLSSILFSLCLLKEKYVTRNYVNEDLNDATDKLIKRLEKLKRFYLLIFSQTINRFDQSKSPFLHFNYQNYILFNHHYLMFYVNSLKFYYPIKGNLYTRRFYCSGDYNFVDYILLECRLCIQYGIQLSGHYLNYFSVGCFTQCLIFLINYGHKTLGKSDNIIEMGINYIKELSKVERFSKFAALNLIVLDFIDINKEKQQAILDNLSRNLLL